MDSPVDQLRFLLDEHYPEWLAVALREHGIDAVAVVSREDLRSQDDSAVLRAAASEGRIVVTEDVTTFAPAIATVPEHAGVVFCHHSRFPRTRVGISALGRALAQFDRTLPAELQGTPFVWWLANEQ